MAVRTADAEWKGDLKGGSGTVRSASGALSGQFSFSSRFEEGTGTNPEAANQGDQDPIPKAPSGSTSAQNG